MMHEDPERRAEKRSEIRGGAITLCPGVVR